MKKICHFLFISLISLVFNQEIISTTSPLGQKNADIIADIYNSLTSLPTEQLPSSFSKMRQTGFSCNHAGILFPWDNIQTCKKRITDHTMMMRILYQLELNRDYYGFLFLNNPTIDTHVLDAGCGCGISSILMHTMFDCYVDGYTLGAKEVERATALAQQNNCTDKLKFAQGDMLQLPVPDNSYDVIWMSESSEYIQSLSDLFCEIKRVGKNHGRLVIFTGCAKNRHIKKKIDNIYYTSLHQVKDYLAAAKKHRFKMVHKQNLKLWVTPYFELVLDAYNNKVENQLIIGSLSGDLDYYLLCFDIQK